MKMDEMTNFWRNHKSTFFFVLLAAFILVLICWYFYNFKCTPDDGFGWCPQSTKEEWGQFGDYFGGILNPVLSFFVFCFAYKTYMAQKSQFETNNKSAQIQNFTSSTMSTVSKIESILSKKNTQSRFNESYGKSLETLFYAFAGMCERSQNGGFSQKYYVDFLDVIDEFSQVEQEISFQLAILNQVSVIWNVDKKTLATQMCIAFGSSESIYGIWILYKYLRYKNGNWNGNIEKSTSMKIDMLEATILHFDVINFEEVVIDVTNAEEAFDKYHKHFYPELV